MPEWLQYLLWTAAGLTAVTAIYRGAIRPVTKGVTATVEALPLIRELLDEMLPVLREVVLQVRHDSGSNLRDTIDVINEHLESNDELVKEVAARLEAHTEEVADRLAKVAEAADARHAAQSAWLEGYLKEFKHGNEGLMEALITTLGGTIKRGALPKRSQT